MYNILYIRLLARSTVNIQSYRSIRCDCIPMVTKCNDVPCYVLIKFFNVYQPTCSRDERSASVSSANHSIWNNSILPPRFMSFNTVVTNLLGDIDDEQVWIRPPFSAKNTLHSSLCTFEQTFRCPICGELLHVPVSIHPCQHSFCSECIRAHVKSGLASLKREAKCPVCRQDIPRDLKTLQPNRTVDTMVRQYKGLRDQLKEALRKSCQGNEDFIPDEQTGTIESEEAVPLDNKKRRRTTRSGSAAIGDVTFVPPTKTPMEVPVLRKTRPNTHYMGMNKNKLADLCRKDGLNDVGDAATLKARHQAFTSLYNAECDSFTPRPASEIAQEINKREQAKKVESFISAFNNTVAICHPPPHFALAPKA